MNAKEKYTNSININKDTPFPYMMIKESNLSSFPLTKAFRVMHWHEDLQFIYVTKGELCVKTLGKEEGVSVGNGIFINKSVIHRIQCKGTCEYNSYVFPDYLVSFYIGSPATILTRNITNSPNLSTVALSNRLKWCLPALKILRELSALDENDSLFSYEVLTRLSVLWLIILRNVTVPQKESNNVTVKRMQKFLQYIADNYSDEITIEKLAACANVSTSELFRCFKNVLQTTPYRYIMDFRLSKAAELLSNTTLSIGSISEKTGFHQQSYLGRCFYEKEGCTPTQFRKHSQKIQSD